MPTFIKAAKDALDQAKKQTDYLKQLLDYLKRGGTGGPIIIPVSNTP